MAKGPETVQTMKTKVLGSYCPDKRMNATFGSIHFHIICYRIK